MTSSNPVRAPTSRPSRSAGREAPPTSGPSDQGEAAVVGTTVVGATVVVGAAVVGGAVVGATATVLVVDGGWFPVVVVEPPASDVDGE